MLLYGVLFSVMLYNAVLVRLVPTQRELFLVSSAGSDLHLKGPKTVQINNIITITLRTCGISIIVLIWPTSGRQKATLH